MALTEWDDPVTGYPKSWTAQEIRTHELWNLLNARHPSRDLLRELCWLEERLMRTAQRDAVVDHGLRVMEVIRGETTRLPMLHHRSEMAPEVTA